MQLSVLEFAAPVLAATASSDPIGELGVQLHFARDDSIYSQGDPSEFVYRIVSGLVRTARVTDDGRRQIGGFYYAGDMLALEDENEHCFSAEAMNDCVVVAIRRRVLDAAAARDSSVARQLWTAGYRSLRKMQSHLVQIGRKTALERVGAILAELASRVPGEEVDLPMSRQDIADYLGLTIETVSRMFTQLQASGVIVLTGLRRMRVSNRPALQKLAA